MAYLGSVDPSIGKNGKTRSCILLRHGGIPYNRWTIHAHAVIPMHSGLTRETFLTNQGAPTGGRPFV